MNQAPDKDIATALQAAGLGTLSQNPGPQTIAWGPPLDPTQIGADKIKLWVFITGGPPPTPYINGGASSEYDVSVQVRVRSIADGFEAGQTLARQVRDALHCKPPASYFDVRADTSEPLYLGQDDAGMFEWSVPFTVRWTG